MKSKEFFNEFFKDDIDVQEQREYREYLNFKDKIPTVLTIEEFIEKVFKPEFNKKTNPDTLKMCKRYLVEHYFTNRGVYASDEYKRQFIDRIKKMLEYYSDTSYITIRYINELLIFIIEHFTDNVTATIMPKKTLEYLNKLYKNKII